MLSRIERIRNEVSRRYNVIQAIELDDDTLITSIRSLYGTIAVHEVEGCAVLACDSPRIKISASLLRDIACSIEDCIHPQADCIGSNAWPIPDA